MKKRVLVTGSRGFIGRNLLVQLRARTDLEVTEFTRATALTELCDLASGADVVIHLAGANRPKTEAGFAADNVNLTDVLAECVSASDRRPHVVFASSIQAELDNPYGASKRRAEERLRRWSADTEGRLNIFRLPNVFGKWCRPNYNSVVATFCFNIARGLPISVRDPERELTLVHVDDVVEALMRALDSTDEAGGADDAAGAIPFERITVGRLAERLYAFHGETDTLMVPTLTGRFDRQLYGTYVSYLEPAAWAYRLRSRRDDRGDLAEFIKSHAFGQVFVSRTRPGITRGNHYHHTKVEKFLVLAGFAVIRLRHVDGSQVHEFFVRGEDYEVVQIPPGYTHSITNVGDSEVITLFWASELFEPERPDTIPLAVDTFAPEELR